MFFAILQRRSHNMRVMTLPFPEMIKSANLFMAESPAASIGVLGALGGEGLGDVRWASGFYISQQGQRRGIYHSPLMLVSLEKQACLRHLQASWH